MFVLNEPLVKYENDHDKQIYNNTQRRLHRVWADVQTRATQRAQALDVLFRMQESSWLGKTKTAFSPDSHPATEFEGDLWEKDP